MGQEEEIEIEEGEERLEHEPEGVGLLFFFLGD